MPPLSVQRCIANRDVAIGRIQETLAVAQDAKTNANKLTEFKMRYSKLESFYKQFESYHSKIVNLKAEEGADVLREQEVIRVTVDRNYFEIKAIHYDLVEAVENDANNSVSVNTYSHAKLPKISLPTFSGVLKEWPNFRDLFTTLVDKHPSLTNIEKFQYLLSSTSNEALEIVKGVTLSNENYPIAFQNLVKRYDNKRLLAVSYWNEIVRFPKLDKENVHSLRKLLNVFSENLSALDVLEFPVDEWDFPLFNILIEKLDTNTRTRFELANSETDLPTYADLSAFLSNHCKALEAIHSSSIKDASSSPKHSNSHPHKFNNYKTNTKTSLIASTHETQSCGFCNSSEHSSYKCSTMLNLSPYNRFLLAKKRNLCLNCLRSSHQSKNCPSKSTCRICQNNLHHTLLHFPNDNNSFTKKNENSGNKTPLLIANNEVHQGDNSSTSQSSHASTLITNCNNISQPSSTNAISFDSTVLLSTAEVFISDKFGNRQKIRVLLDSASQASFITSRCLDRLGLVYSPLSATIHGIGNSLTVQPKGKISCFITSCYFPRAEFHVEAFVLPQICADMPNCPLSTENWSHISTLKLADPKYFVSHPVDMLLSADIFARILLGGKIEGPKDAPIAINTLFGWILSGRVRSSPPLSSNLCSLLTVSPLEHASLDKALQKFWELESIPNSSSMSEEDIRCETIFQSTTTRDSTGRYIVELPFSDDSLPNFSDSRDIARCRFFTLENRLYRNEDLKSQYFQFMKDYLESGHMSPAPPLLDHSQAFYLPHHSVLKLESSTTKLRVVFNASQKCNSGLSLNDTLCTGPKLQSDIVGLLLRFRVHSVVFTADIKQMFLQILVSERHRNFQRIFWRFSKNDPLQEFVLNTVTFGLACSPYLANRTIKQLAIDEGDRFPLVTRILNEDIYIDDILSGCESIEQAFTVVEQLLAIFKSAGFELRKWASNRTELLDSLPDTLKQSTVGFDDQSLIKVLGLRWSPSRDIFTFKVNVLSKDCTKRSILSELARIFDPLGFLTPLTFFAKHLTQRLWSMGLDWDQTPPSDITHLWNQYKNELGCLSSVEIPRFLNASNKHLCDLHGFCDASERGYAAIVYLRIQNIDLSYRVVLISARSKVAPLKTLSIPRLELSAAVLLADLIGYIQSVYTSLVPISRVYAWSDSKVAISWIKSCPSRWKTFVANRVARIQEKVSPEYWFHIPGVDNPADIASRGCLPAELLNNRLWWAGPPFLENLNVPEYSDSSDSCDEVLSEERRNVLNVIVENNPILLLLDKFSSFDKIKNIVAYCIKFMNALRTKTKCSSNLSFSDLKIASAAIIRTVQSDVFSEDISKLQRGKLISKPLRKLCPFFDESQILRVGGRLVNSKLSYDQKFPILLPRQHRLTTLIIENFHIKYLHPGLRTLHFLLAQQYWILSPRRAIRSVISNCHKCFKVNPKPFQPLMGNLPSFRVSQVKPFSCVAVDFGGPFYIKTSRLRGAKVQKAYLCLFVCCAVKALHLELASDLSTDCFLAAFRRFLSRRGRVSHVHSDGGGNFQGSSRYFQDIMKDVVTSENITWSFNPPATPHFGGLYESGIKSVKTHLHRVIGEQILTYEEFNTLLVQVEAVLNSRPLIDISSDPNDLSVLTPGHFLTLEPLSALPDPDMSNVNLNRLDRWRLLQRLHQDFWKRWHTEYLHSLNQGCKWADERSSVCVNDVVLLKDENLPPLKWKLGKIIELFPGKDGISRVALIKTATGIYKRGLTKLCPLPK